MSNIGTIYVLNFKTGGKQVFPIVYENKLKYFCKEHGSYDLRSFYKDKKYYNGVYTLNEYMEKSNQLKHYRSSNIKVFVEAGNKYNFPELNDVSISCAIESLRKDIDDRKNKILGLTMRFKRIPDEINSLKKEIEELEEKIYSLEKSLEEENE